MLYVTLHACCMRSRAHCMHACASVAMCQFGKLLSRCWDSADEAGCGHSPWRFLSWNVLKDGGTGQFEDGNERGLQWENRSLMELEEIRRSNADIVCLCECDRFAEFWLPELRACGYELGARMPSRRGSSEKPSGATIFARAARFENRKEFSFVCAKGPDFSRRPAACVVCAHMCVRTHAHVHLHMRRCCTIDSRIATFVWHRCI